MKKIYSILMALVAFCGIGAQAQEIHLIGAFCDWSHDNAKVFVETSTSGVYEINEEFTLTNEFKVATSDWSTVDLGSNGDQLVVGEAYSLVTQGGNIYLTGGDECAVTRVVYDSNASTLTIEGTMSGGSDTPNVEGEASGIYLRGGFNNWQAQSDYEFVSTSEENIYELNKSFTLNGAFKVASSDWSTYNFGSNGSGIIPGTAYNLVAGGQSNIEFALEGDYDVTYIKLDLNQNQLTITAEWQAQGDLTEVYVIGDNNSWNFNDATGKLSLDTSDSSNSTYTGTVTFDESAAAANTDNLCSWRIYERMGMQGSWGMSEYKAENTTSGTLKRGSETSVCTAAGTYTVTFNITTGEFSLKATSTAIENAATAGTTATTVRHNLAGQRVGHGYKGLVIENGRKLIAR